MGEASRLRLGSLDPNALSLRPPNAAIRADVSEWRVALWCLLRLALRLGRAVPRPGARLVIFLQKPRCPNLRTPKALRPTTPCPAIGQLQDAIWLRLSDGPSLQFIEGPAPGPTDQRGPRK